MNLILWRHAEAEDQAASDLVRQLTTRGRKQAQAVAKWLRTRLDDDAVFLVSPATRTIQTVEAFSDQYRVVEELAPDGSAQDVLDAAGWPEGIAETVVVVGHQPTLGHVAALSAHRRRANWSLKKAGIWWFEQRARGGDDQVVLRAVTKPRSALKPYAMNTSALRLHRIVIGSPCERHARLLHWRQGLKPPLRGTPMQELPIRTTLPLRFDPRVAPPSAARRGDSHRPASPASHAGHAPTTNCAKRSVCATACSPMKWAHA